MPKNRRATDNRYFCNYFYRDELPRIATPNGEKKILALLATEPFDPGVLIESINQDLQEANRKNRPDLRRLVFNRIDEIISTLDARNGARLLIAYGHVTKNLIDDRDHFLFSEKQYAANAVWRFVQKFTSNEACAILKNLLRVPVSDEVLTNIVFYAINPVRRHDHLELSKECVEDIKKIFSDICQNRLMHNNDVRNVFDSTVSDSPWQLLYRWADSAGNEVTEEYFIKLFQTFPEALKIFILYFIPQRDDIIDKLKGLKVLISFSTLRQIVDEENATNMLSTLKGYEGFRKMIEIDSNDEAIPYSGK